MSSRSSARICACTDTSSAVVGSSAISSLGSQASAMAIMTRWRMPPESSCGYWRRRRGTSLMRTWSSSCAARVRASRQLMPRCADQRLGDLVADAQVRRQRGHRVLEDHRDVAAAQGRADGPADGTPRQRALPADARPRRQQSHERQERLALAGARTRRSRRGSGRAPARTRCSLDHALRRRSSTLSDSTCSSAASAIAGPRAGAQRVAQHVERHQQQHQQAAGTSSIQGEDSISCAPSLMRLPRLAYGSCTPSPRKLRKLSNRMTCGMVSVA